MSDQGYNVAIETSGRAGSVSLGRGDALLGTAEIGQQRHAVGLLPALEGLCAEHGTRAAEIGEVYVSVGPGSFTGLRIGVTTAKMLGRSVGAKLVAVATLDVVAANGPTDAERVAVCLNAKRGQYFAGIFERDERDVVTGWRRVTEPALLTMAELLERGGRPLTVIGDRVEEVEAEGVRVLDGEWAKARSEVVWKLGRRAAEAGDFVEPVALVPRYVRLPEAEEVWRAKQGG